MKAYIGDGVVDFKSALRKYVTFAARRMPKPLGGGIMAAVALGEKQRLEAT
jgi:hypothetical protein